MLNVSDALSPLILTTNTKESVFYQVLCTDGETGPEDLSNLAEITSLLSGKAGVKPSSDSNAYS